MTQPPVRITDMIELAELERKTFYDRACDAMRAGARIRDPRNIFIRGDLICEPGVEIDINVIIEGKVHLGNEVKVGAHSTLRNATIGAGCTIHPYSTVDGATVGEKTFIGPYGRVRPGSAIGSSVQIGNFVEIKNAQIGSGSRVNHLSFLGDATLGENVTIGAGTITCNHDGSGPQRTVIEANVYVGAGCLLVAPITIGEGATIGAGSTITHDAPAGRLTVARARQATIDAWRGRRQADQR